MSVHCIFMQVVGVHRTTPDPQGPGWFSLRRWRDLNPREGTTLNPLSRRAP
ncbi:MAG: hypothetical protein JWQ93_3339 [Marmoricola sp.]|nr:hypothetical protein [Marmoricola sp.]